MANPVNKYVTSIGLQQPSASDLTDGTTGTGAVVQAGSPTLTGSPIAPTQASSDSSTKVATTAFVATAVSNAVSGVNPAVSVQAATTSASNTSGFTYNNGVSGIGATLTGAVNTALTVDGYTFTALGQRLLVKNDTQSPSGAFNGVYYVTQVQTSLLPLILTRALDFDMPSDINNTGAIPVINGTVNGTTSWVLTTLVTTVGTDPLTFAQFSYAPSAIALLASPAFTGTPTAPTAAGGTNTTQIATTAFVQSAVTGGGAVSSVFGRTGAVVAVSTDYWLVQGRSTIINADGSTTTFNVNGDVLTIQGTQGGGSPTAGAPTSQYGPTIASFSNAIGTLSGWQGNLNYRTGRNIRFHCECGPARTNNARYWFGLSDQTATTMSASDNPAGNYAAFRYSTVAGDTNYQAITKDGTTQTVANTSTAPSGINGGGNSVILDIIFNDATPNVVFYINGTAVATNTTHLPSASTNMRFFVCQLPDTNTTNQGIYLMSATVTQDK